MPGTIIEQHGSRSFNIGINAGAAVFKYFVFGESDELTVELLVKANAPLTWYAFTRDDVKCDRRNALDQWDCVVNYRLLAHELAAASVPSGDPDTDPPPTSPSASPPADGELLNGVTFTISLENEHIDKSIATVASHMRLGPDTAGAWNDKYGGLIGVVRDGNGGQKVMGCERGSPIINVRRDISTQGMSYRYMKTLIRMVGRSNATPWWLFGQEDAMIFSVTGQQLDVPGRFSLTFEWLWRLPKLMSATVDPIPGVDTAPIELFVTKRGMQFGWYAYAEKMVDGVPLMKPVEIFVERICDTDDFNWLGI